MPVISIEGLTKDYGEGRGIFDVSFYVDKGECFGFLGPNGAGKSTTIRHLMGFSKPDRGFASIEGKDARKDRSVLANVGYIPGEVSLPNNLTAKEILVEQLLAKKVRDTRRLADLVHTFQIDLQCRGKDMSTGMKRKVAIAAALLSNPAVLILDEPTSGLDPTMQDVFLNRILEEKRRKKTILLSSHIFSEIEHCSDRIGIIKDGKLLTILEKKDILKGGSKTVVASFGEEGLFDRLLTACPFRPFDIDRERKAVRFSISDEERGRLLSLLLSFKPLDIRIEKESLRERFLSYYREDREYTGL